MVGLLVHEWIETTGGAERVLDEWAEMFPDAVIHCLWNDAPERYAGRVVRESWMAKSFIRAHKSIALPLMAWYWRRLDVSGFDWVLVSSHSFAHHVAVAAVRDGVPVYVYAHTPARYLWAPEHDVRAAGLLGRVVSPILRRIDRRGVRSAAHYSANSEYIAARSRKAWFVEPAVIYPPVKVHSNNPVKLGAHDQRIADQLPAQYILGVSRFVPQKRLDLVVQYASLLGGVPLVICGRGPEEQKVRRMAENAGVDCQLIASPSDALLREIMRRAELFVFPPVEDFGILPVEAMASGIPCLVNSDGGAVESVMRANGGVSHSFDDMSSETAAELYEAARSMDLSRISASLETFSSASFAARIRSWMRDVLD